MPGNSPLKVGKNKLWFTSNCDKCNPYPHCEPVLYDDPQQRDYEARAHANLTGHTMQVGFVLE
jgi:hypothetical protein